MQHFLLPLLAAFLGCPTPSSSAPTLPVGGSHWVDVFSANDSLSEGIHQFRIPALVLTARGTLIAIAEARTAPQTDCGFKWLVARRSMDNGSTWSASVDVAGRATPDFASGNPQAVYHAPSGRIVVVFGAKYIRGDPAARCSPGDAVFAVDDGGSDGAAWGAPRNISADLGGWSGWGGVVPGPGAGAVTTLRNPGRILMSGSRGAYGADVLFFSDDGGARWATSATPLLRMDESGPVELADGSVYVTLRNAGPCGCQAFALSTDGGATFGPVQYDATLISPQCQASVAVMGGRLFFANSADRDARGNLTVRRAAAGGGGGGGGAPVWEDALLLAPGLTWGGYSSLAGPLGGAAGRSGGVLAERNDSAGGEVISYATVPLFGWPPAPPPPPPPFQPQVICSPAEPPEWRLDNYRIPALVRTAAGTLIAVAEARTTRLDCTYKWLAFRRSTDNGTTWSPPAEIFGRALRAPQGAGNPVLVFDATTRTIILHGAVNAPGQCNPVAWTFQVTDGGSDGRTWGAPVNISAFLGPWAGATPGPGTGAQVPPGAPHAGRLLVPAHFGAYKFDVVWYSDDHGATWTVAAPPLPGLDEVAVAALPNGTLLLNARTDHLNASCACRAVSASHDGGATWELPLRFDATLIEPVCQGSLTVLAPLRSAGGGAALFFSNPASTTERVDLTVRRSDDGGGSWPRAQLLAAEPGDGYSCMFNGAPIVGAGGAEFGGILFETPNNTISFGLFNADVPPAPPPPPPPRPATLIPAAHPSVAWVGRHLVGADRATVSFDFPGVTATFTASNATYFTAVFTAACGPERAGARLESAVDGAPLDTRGAGAFWVLPPASPAAPYRIALARGLDPSRPHSLAIRAGVEARWAACSGGATVALAGVETDGAPPSGAPPPASPRLIEWVGDSITAGFGTAPPCAGAAAAAQEDASRGAALAAACPALGAACALLAVSGDTAMAPAGGAPADKPPIPLIYNRSLTYNGAAAWDFASHPTPQAVVVNLGTNDRALPNFAADFEPALAGFLLALSGPAGWYAGQGRPPPRALAWCGPMVFSYCAAVEGAVAAAVAAGADARFLGAVNATLDGCDGHPGEKGQAELGRALAPLIEKAMGW